MFHEQEWKSIVVVPMAVETSNLPPLSPSYQWDLYNGEPHVAFVGYQLTLAKRFGFKAKDLPKVVFELWGFVKAGKDRGLYRFQKWEANEKKEIKTASEIEFQEGGMGGYQKPVMDGVYSYSWTERDNRSAFRLKTVALPQPLSFDPLSAFLWQRNFLVKSGTGLTKIKFSDGFAWDTQSVEMRVHVASDLRSQFQFLESLPALVEMGYVVRNLKVKL